jgi:hypothetical protein
MGLRRAELQKLRWTHADLERRRLTLHDTKGAKLAQSGAKDDVKNLSQIWAVAPVLVKLALQDDQPSQR